MLGQMHSLQEIYLEDNNDLEVHFKPAAPVVDVCLTCWFYAGSHPVVTALSKSNLLCALGSSMHCHLDLCTRSTAHPPPPPPPPPFPLP